MADIVYRGNLKAASFPFLSELFGRSVIVKGQDQNFVSGLAAKESLDSTIGIPQIYYCHNVMPNDAGYQSVGYQNFAAEIPGITGVIVSVGRLVDSSGNIAHIANTADGKLYSLKQGGTWVECTSAIVGLAGRTMTIAIVSGVSYIYFSGLGCYTYDYGTNLLSAQTLTGLTAADILGIAGVKGYLIAYSADAVVWSSTIDPTDFVPSLATGAGGGSVEAARGAIKVVIPVLSGMIVFTASNAVAAIASDNPRYPFNFTEVVGAGGLSDISYASYDTNSGSIYAYTTAGMQVVSLKSATTVFPELTDFLSGSMFEDFNEATDNFSIQYTNASVLKRLAVIAGRYLVVSYGSPSLTHAIVYDIAYKQFGRLKIDHADCFEFNLYDQTLVETPRKSIGFVSETGQLDVVDFDFNSPNSSGVLIVGKFQYVRSRLLTLQGAEVEVIRDDADFELLDLPTLDGKTFENPISGYLASTSARCRNYSFHNTGVNHSLLFKGEFNATSLVLTFTVHGGR